MKLEHEGWNWTPEEQRELLEGFANGEGLSLQQLSEKHQRTKAAITSRLILLGKLRYTSEGYQILGPIWASKKDAHK